MYHLDPSEQARFGMHEHDGERGEEQTEHSASFQQPDACPHCHATRKSDHTNDCPHFEEQPLPF